MLNPKSGKGDSQSMFEKTLKPLMEEFALSYELFVTKRAKDAEDYLQRFVSLHQLMTKNKKSFSFVLISISRNQELIKYFLSSFFFQLSSNIGNISHIHKYNYYWLSFNHFFWFFSDFFNIFFQHFSNFFTFL